MEDLTLHILWLVTTWIVASIILGFIDGLRTTTQELETKLRQRLDEIIHRVRVEHNQDTMYWYDFDDGEFLAQGRTQQEVIAVLRDRFPDHIFYLETNEIVAKPDWTPIPAPIRVVDKEFTKL